MPRCAVALLCLVLAACSGTAADAPRLRPSHWAQPVIGSAVGNWFQVSPELHRCEQPSAAGMRELAAFGIRTVVNLRAFHSDADEAQGTGLAIVEVPMDAGDLSYPELLAALRALLAAPKPVAVHCWHGSDRTGTVVAAWRVAMQGWTPAAALDEMVAGGYGHHGMYGNLRALVLSLDRGRLRADLGLKD